MDILYFTIACLSVGALAGFLGGMLGIGGGVVIVPALILLFDRFGLFMPADGLDNTSTLIAVGTSLATIIFTSAAAARAQIKARMVDWPIIRTWTIPLMVGSFSAGYVAALMSMPLLRTLIAAFLLFVALVMLASWKPPAQRRLPGTTASALIGGGAGLVSGIAGIGGGNVIVPTLVYLSTPVHRATATSSTLGFPVALAGTLGYISRGWAETSFSDGALGYVYLPAFAALITTTILCAPIGVRAAHKLPALTLRKLFGALLFVVALRMLYTAYF